MSIHYRLRKKNAPWILFVLVATGCDLQDRLETPAGRPGLLASIGLDALHQAPEQTPTSLPKTPAHQTPGRTPASPPEIIAPGPDARTIYNKKTGLDSSPQKVSVNPLVSQYAQALQALNQVPLDKSFRRENFLFPDTLLPSRARHEAFLGELKTDCWSEVLDTERLPKPSRLCSANDAFHDAFAELVKVHPTHAVAWWIFDVTRIPQSSSDAPPSWVKVVQKDRSGNPFVDGFRNDGIFFVTAEGWAHPMLVKLVPEAWDIEQTIKKSLAIPARPGCLEIHAARAGMIRNARDSEFVPIFVAPVAAQWWGGDNGSIQPNVGQKGLMLMPLIDGAHLGAGPETYGRIDSQTATEISWTLGRSLALFHLPFVGDLSGDIFQTRSYVHNDLHAGNILIGQKAPRLYLLDFEKMRADGFWWSEVLGQIAIKVPSLTAHERSQLNLPQAATGCREALANAMDAHPMTPNAPQWRREAQHFTAFSRGYLLHVPPHLRRALEDAFDGVCHEAFYQGESPDQA